MARPAKYPWDKIKLDYESGLSQSDLHKKYEVPYNALNDHITRKGWLQSEQSKAIIKGFDNISEQVSELKAETPELAKNTIDIIIDKHPQFKRAMVALSTKLFNRMFQITDQAKAHELPQLAKGMQTITDTLGISQRHSNTNMNMQVNNNQITAVKIVEDDT